jgi:hypothetical protein
MRRQKQCGCGTDFRKAMRLWHRFPGVKNNAAVAPISRGTDFPTARNNAAVVPN